MNKFTFIGLLILVPSLVYGQYDLNWHMGACTYLDFRSGQMILISSPDSIDGFSYTNSSLSRKDSTLAIFTNGTILFRSDGSKIPNGDTLAATHQTLTHYPFGIDFSQGCIFVSKPSNDSIIYMFYQAIENDSLLPISKIIYLAIINMNADSGRGVVLSKDIHIYDSSDTLMWGKLQAVRNSNGRDWWLISKKHDQNEFLEWLIKPDTILGPFHKFYSGFTGLDSYFDQSVISQDGSKYAILFNDMCLQLFDFDRCTGDFNLILNGYINDPNGVGGGVAFSKSGHYLYATTSSHCWQLDMNSSNIFNSLDSIATYDGFTDNFACDFAYCRLAPDDKIYISPGSTSHHWARINNPELPGTLADVQQHVVNLYCYNNNAFPNLPNFNLGADTVNFCDSTLSVNEHQIIKLNIFPNPSQSIIRVTGNISSSFYYSIYDLAGREIVSNSKSNSTEIDVQKLSSGLFLLKLLDKDQTVYYLKFVKK